jgi:hypothetical protein
MANLKNNHFNYNIYNDIYIEVSWLYEQHLGFLESPLYQWANLEPFEIRLNNFLDALINHDGLIDDFCLEHAFDGDIGDLFTAVSVLAKRKGLPAIKILLNDTSLNDLAMRTAIIDAVNYSLSEDDLICLVNELVDFGNPVAIEMAAKIASFHQLDFSDVLTLYLKQLDKDGDLDSHELLLHASLTALTPALDKNTLSVDDLTFFASLIEKKLTDEVLQIIAITLLKAKYYEPIKDRTNQLSNYSWLILPISLLGNLSAKSFLLDLLVEDAPEQTKEALIALGLIGSSDTISTLIHYLATEDFAEKASIALQLITGADLYEDAFIPDEIDPDELFPDELARYEKGEPVYPEGEEPGIKVHRISQDEYIWQQWLENNSSKFSSTNRYRFGRVISLPSLLEALKKPDTPIFIRNLIVDEIALQYGIELKIDKKMFVNAQLQVIDQALLDHS